jgi:hypothetical protein
MLEISIEFMSQPLKVTCLTAFLISGSDTSLLKSLVSDRIKSIRKTGQRERKREREREGEG